MSSRKRQRPHSKPPATLHTTRTGANRGGKSARQRPPSVPPAVLFEDAEIVVVSKPAGLATANVPRGQESLLTWLRSRAGCSGGGAGDPKGVFFGVVSRLDQPVSGVVVIARTRRAAASLSAQFRDRTVQKTYHALVEGRFPGPVGETAVWTDLLERPLDESRGASAGAAAQQKATTQVELVARGVEVSLVKLLPKTGRRHQLRVQLSSRRCPIVGDRLYGSRLPFPDGIALHSTSLEFAHPATGQPVSFQAPWPLGWQRAAGRLVLPKSPAERGSR